MSLADLDPRAVAIAAKLVRQRSRQQFRVEDRCFDKQLEVIAHQSRRKAIMCSRRAGKSFTNAPALLDAVATPPYTNVFYAAPTFKRAKRILWSQLKEINRAHALGGIPNETEAMITFPDLGPDVHVYLIGLKDKSEADKGRGIPGKLWIVDEAQDLREDVIQYAIKDVFGAGQLDHFGSMWIQGTPGPVKAGFFYDVTAGKEAHKWQQFHWTWRDNPLLPIRKAGYTVEEIEAKILAEFGLHPDDPTWLREWCGLWVEDEGALVFSRPEACEWQSAPQHDWTYVLCFDIGVNDADAIAVLGWRKGSRVVNLVSEDIRANQDVSDLATKLDELYERWRPVKAVGDLGSLGKKIGLEITRRWSVPIEAADKTRKFEHIALLNADIRKGYFRAPADSRFVADSRKLSWDLEARAKNERKISSRYHSDICDSVLYGHRATSAFMEAPPPEPDTPETIEERLIANLVEAAEREEYEEFGDYAENGW